MTDFEAGSLGTGMHEVPSFTDEQLERARLAAPLRDTCEIVPIGAGRGELTEKTRQRIEGRYLSDILRNYGPGV